MSLIFSLSQKVTLDEVGAKALNLHRLHAFGYNVPEAWFMPVQAFRDFMAENSLDGLYRELKANSRLSRNKAIEAARELRRGVMQGKLPKVWLEALEEVLPLKAGATFSVRSSSVNEDLEQNSYAGQYASLLNVPATPSALERAVLRVWASQWSDELVSYAFKNSMNIPGAEMGIVVQKMVQPRIAGVLFSYNPFTFNKNEMVLEYVQGLGEGLVSGEKTPEHLIFNRRENSFKSADNIPRDYLKAFDRLVQSAVALEKKTGLAVDVEWAYGDDQLWFLQMRAITTLGQNRIIWTDENVGEVIPDIVTPYSWSILEPITNGAFRYFLKNVGVANYPEHGLFGLYKGKVYLNHTAFNETMSRFYLSHYKPRPGRSEPMVVQWLKLFLFPVRVLNALGRVTWLARSMNRRIDAHLARHAARLRELRFDKKETPRTAYTRINAIMRLHHQTMAFHVSNTILAELYFQILKKLTESWCATCDEVSAEGLLAGLGEAESARSGKALWAIALLIQERPELHELFMLEDTNQLEKRLVREDQSGQVVRALRAFIKEFGHGALHEFELLYPRWHEDRSYIYTNIRNYLKGDLPDRKEAGEQLARHRLAMLEKVRKQLNPVKRLVFNHVYRRAAQLGSQRENLKQALLKAHAELKKHLLHIGRNLIDRGILEAEDDIFFMTHQEIAPWLEEPPPVKKLLPLIRERRKKRAADMKEPHPAKMMQVGELWRPVIEADAENADHQGIGCSAGVVEGVARVIVNENEFGKLRKGEILVAPATNPGWTPLFMTAAGVVTEIGGALSHGAIIAREYGIPMVTAVKQATQRIPDGARIRINGANGAVEILN